MKSLQFAVAGFVCTLGFSALADVKLPAVFSDNMVLQKSEKTPFFGTADKGEAVTVKVGAAAAETTAGQDGKWKLTIDTRGVNGPVDVSIAGKNSIDIHNALVGEVWIASGQSNMEMSVGGVKNVAEERAAANFPQIRMFTVKKATSDVPLQDVQ